MELRRPGLIARLSAPLRGMGQRFILISLVIAGFGFMLLGKSDVVLVDRLRSSVADVAAPMLEAATHPVQAFNRGLTNIRELFALRSENARLRREVARLRAWHATAQALAAENKSFRSMLNYKGPARDSFVSARVIADGRGPFVKSVLVNAGVRDGAAKGQAATAFGRLVGRVTLAGARSSRVLLLTDLNSRVPVIIGATRTRAILIGDNSPRPRLGFLPENPDIKAGQRVVTSGHGGVLPAGLPVGRIVAGEDGVYRVQPLVDFDRLEYLQIIRFKTVGAPEAEAADKPKRGGRT
ncbi:MAG: rod shape-determining protein MreC [Alphaproteobacteria bacterium]|nr:rod shape-determining protein MreC [Alphaproteobacteria bacterium]